MIPFVYVSPRRPADFSGIPAMEEYVKGGFEAYIQTLSIEDSLTGLDLISGSRDSSNRESLELLYSFLAKAYVEWNLSFPGEVIPAPISADSFRRLHKQFLMGMVKAWIRTNVEVPVPLGEGSISGDRSLEESIPMEVSSPNQPS